MKAIWRFVGTTILGGVLFLTPIVVLGIVLSKAYDFVRRGLQPLTALTAQTLAPGPTMTAILAILVLALMCLLAGLFARTMLAQRIVNGLEATVRWPTKAAKSPKRKFRAAHEARIRLPRDFGRNPGADPIRL